MCGYCVESAIFSLLSNPDPAWKGTLLSSSIYSFLYLQETRPLSEGLQWIPAHQTGNPIVLVEIASRGLEILLTHGVASSEYRALLANPVFVSAIKAFCQPSSQTEQLPADSRLDVSRFAWISDYRVFTEEGYLQAKLNALGPMDAEIVLEQYVRLYLKGINLGHNDLNGEFEQTGVYDPLRDVCEEEHKLITRSLPILWVALIWLAQRQADSRIIREIVRTKPAGVPEFGSVALWLQRRAACLIYDHSGIKHFLDDLPLIRPELFQYLAIQRAIPAEELAQLTARIDQLPDGDHQGDNFSLSRWLREGDIQLG